MNEELSLEWKIHLPNLLREIAGNPNVAILSKPIAILGHILYDLSEKAARINDPELNAVMCRLTLYEVADPQNPNYDPDVVDSVYKKAKELSK